jgi:molybdopterin converting factor small subunit
MELGPPARVTGHVARLRRGSVRHSLGSPASAARTEEAAMSVTVRVPPVFRTMTGGQSSVSVEGTTVSEVLANLDAAHPGFSDKLLGDDGKLVRYVNVFVDDDDVRFMDGLDTPVPDGVTVSIMQAVAGGS